MAADPDLRISLLKMMPPRSFFLLRLLCDVLSFFVPRQVSFYLIHKCGSYGFGC
jgi:hypothetical protein